MYSVFILCAVVALASGEEAQRLSKVDDNFPLNKEAASEELETLERVEKSLLNQFPFNAQEKTTNQQPQQKTPSQLKTLSQELPSFSDRQGYGPTEEISTPPVIANIVNTTAINGKKCVDKVEMTTETIFDDIIHCDHSYDRQCHTSYTTIYEAQQEEDCEENYRKSCYIDYEDTAFNQTVQICRRPMMKPSECEDDQQSTVCRTVYESECWTKQHEHVVVDDVPECNEVVEEKCTDVTVGYTTEPKCEKWARQECNVVKQEVKKYSPVTSCTKEPREVCASSGCNLVEGDEVCHDEEKTIVSQKPIETCNIEPVRVCQHVTKLVPKLKPQEECTDVPKEVCSRMRTNPRVVKKPVIKKWCYVPSEESGLA